MYEHNAQSAGGFSGVLHRDVCCAESKCAQYENSLGSASGQRASTPTARPGRSGAITVAYSTGWSDAYIHYQRGDGCAFSLPSWSGTCKVSYSTAASSLSNLRMIMLGVLVPALVSASSLYQTVMASQLPVALTVSEHCRRAGQCALVPC